MSYREQSREDLLARISDLEEELEKLKNPPIDHSDIDRMKRLAGYPIDIKDINPFDLYHGNVERAKELEDFWR